MKAVRILGIDPGSRLTGWGCVDMTGNQLKHVAHGTLRLSNTGGKSVIPLENRLLLIHKGLTEVIEKYRPTVMSIERVFFAKNAISALKLGQARGAAILSGAIHNLSIVEYSPTEVKAIVVGHGHAEKQQVAKMIQLLTGCGEFATSDASDGLALAICHAQMLISQRNRPLQNLTRRSSKRLSLAESVGITSVKDIVK